MSNRTPREICDDILWSAMWVEKNKAKCICDRCGIAETCKYHNNPKNTNKVIKDCKKFEMTDEAYEKVVKELKGLKLI